MVFTHSHKVYYVATLCSGCDCDYYVCFEWSRSGKRVTLVSHLIHFSSCAERENVSLCLQAVARFKLVKLNLNTLTGCIYLKLDMEEWWSGCSLI